MTVGKLIQTEKRKRKQQKANGKGKDVEGGIEEQATF